MRINQRQLVILHHLSLQPQTVYSMANGDLGMITGATEMGIHHACKALEENELISSEQISNGQRKSLLKKATPKGREYLEQLRTEPVKETPMSLCDLYILDHIKNSFEVHEALVCMLTRKKCKAKTTTTKEWLDYVIGRYSKAL